MHLEKGPLGNVPGIFKISNLPFDEAKNSRLIAMEESFKGAGRSFLAFGQKFFVRFIHRIHYGFQFPCLDESGALTKSDSRVFKNTAAFSGEAATFKVIQLP